MRTSYFILVVSIFISIASGCEPSSGSSDAVAVASSEPGEPILITEAQTYTEAPVIDRDGNIFISEPFRGPITKITPNGEVSIWAETEGANGHAIRVDGAHLVCDRVRKKVVILDEMGQETGVAASTCGEYALRAPNDLVFDSNGGFYFTDPMDGDDEPIGRVCYVDSNGNTKAVGEWEGFTNGVVINSEETELYVAGTFANAVYKYKITAPGDLGPREILAELPKREDGVFAGPDGMTIDDEGNIYVAQFRNGRVQVLDPSGKVIRKYSSCRRACTNKQCHHNR